MANPNIKGTTTITLHTDFYKFTGSTPNQLVLENSASSGQVYKIDALSSVVDTGVVPNQLLIEYRSSGGTDYTLFEGLSAGGGKINIIDATNPVYLMEGDSIRVTQDAGDPGFGAAADLVVRYQKIS